ncbi:response regulator [Thiocystis violascens]|uniref:Response regulator of citrate/malate metabolism n=1 Tax=Thiocystis violascens (strain ATCC 17096 / DSM 198 / 6111) TaxID=765911 RepID=I3YG13_THIV6|nr:response regulator [Thiocystis violascens]AFL75931.1 response regulator of citrate/malate metabolism [Thiocystis violascens DSM 198]
MRVLIVDDSPAVWRRLFDMLEEFPSVSLLAYANTLAEARRFLAGCRPDLLVLDLSLPDGNGLDLLQGLRAAGMDTKVAVFSNDPDLRRHSLDRGADWHFDKSLEFPLLLSLLSDRGYWREQGVIVGSRAHVES